VCRGIARSSARNFYYAFLLLPTEKRDALAAVYAFMRHADDISDDPGLTLPEKKAKLETYRKLMRRVLAGERTDDAVLMALADAQQRFRILPELFDELITGTAMDVTSGGDGPAAHYQTFQDLQRYCYFVASVVGLVCIRIFGYSDPAAEPLAEQCGVAFQLTNIIRDVKEDALMGRVYLPTDDLARFGHSADELSPTRLRNGFSSTHFQPVLELEASRAREFYGAAEQLIPLIDEDCRPALWALVEIYRRLLEKIATRNYDVFGSKIRLTAAEKTSVLARGFWRRLTG
jgi:phytoene synthase